MTNADVCDDTQEKSFASAKFKKLGFYLHVGFISEVFMIFSTEFLI